MTLSIVLRGSQNIANTMASGYAANNDARPKYFMHVTIYADLSHLDAAFMAWHETGEARRDGWHIMTKCHGGKNSHRRVIILAVVHEKCNARLSKQNMLYGETSQNRGQYHTMMCLRARFRR